MPRHRSLVTVIRDLVQQEVGSAIQSLLGTVPTKEEGDERSSPSSAREVAPRRSRSSTEGCCREDGAREEGHGDARSAEGEERSPPS